MKYGPYEVQSPCEEQTAPLKSNNLAAVGTGVCGIEVRPLTFFARGLRSLSR